MMNYAMERQGDEWHIKSRSMLTPHDQRAGRNRAASARASGRCRRTRRRDASASRTSGTRGLRKPMKVAVLGGGPSGAFAAEQLASAGVETVVFDEKLAWEKPCGGGLT